MIGCGQTNFGFEDAIRGAVDEVWPLEIGLIHIYTRWIELAIFREPFQPIDTVFKLLSKLDKLNLFRFPVQFEIDKRISQVTTKGIPNLKN